MATKKTQLKDSTTGEKMYPVTSSACVGMSDGSGSLDKHLAKITTEYNVSKFHPTGGSGGSNKYDLSTAIGKVPEELRVPGLVVSFLNQQSKVEKWTYQGGTWAAVSFIRQEAGGNKILEWNTDAATTRKQVPANERKAGMQISYLHPESSWVNEQYIGTAVSDGEWAKDTNWEQVAVKKDLDKLIEMKLRLHLQDDTIILVGTPALNYQSGFGAQGYNKGTSSILLTCKAGDVFEVTGTAVGTRREGPLYCMIADESSQVKLVSMDNEVAVGKRISVNYDGRIVFNVKSSEAFEVFKVLSKSETIQDCSDAISSLAETVKSKKETIGLPRGSYDVYDLRPAVGETVSIQKIKGEESYIVSHMIYAHKGDIFELHGKGSYGALWALVSLEEPHTLLDKSAPEDMNQQKTSAKINITQDCLLLYNSASVGITYSITRIRQGDLVTDIENLKTNSDEQLNQAKRCNLITRWCKGQLDTVDEIPIEDGDSVEYIVTPYIDITEEEEYFINIDITNRTANTATIGFYSKDKSKSITFAYNNSAFDSYNPKVCEGWWKIPDMFNRTGMYAFFRYATSLSILRGNQFKDIIILKKSDFQRIYAGELNKIDKIPISTRRTDTFVGSINTFIDKLLAKNPYSRFVFFNMFIPIPYMNRGIQTRWEAMVKAIDALAKYWRTDCLKPDKLNLIHDDHHDLVKAYISDSCHISRDMPDATFFVEITSDTGVTKSGGNITISGGDWTKTISYEVGATVSDILNKIASAYTRWDNEILDDRIILKPKENNSYPTFDERPIIQNSEEVIVTFKRRESSPQKVAAMYRDFLNRQFLTGCNDKIIFHLGTSVPAGSAGMADGSRINYPYYAATKLGIPYYAFGESEVQYKGPGMYNLSKGGSCIRQYGYGKTSGSPRPTSWLTPTSAGGGLKNNIEVLEKKVLGSKLEPDLWVIDWSFNDMDLSLEWLLYDI